uniref:Uncharacterized protein n=1 Tax=Verrucosispora sp. MS100047 TaxID=1410949 RepID=A0A097CSV5_9ACTN|nr:hypothetical protein VASRM7_486 [Verrucosispora sp. MS100047]
MRRAACVPASGFPLLPQSAAHTVLRRHNLAPRAARLAYAILDGTLVPIDRGAERPLSTMKLALSS